MATGWLRGTVKEVPSGDTVVIVGAVKAGPPPEKRITLSSLVAPKLGKRDGTSRDEFFAWESREFLRKKLVGKPCVFKVDYVVEQIGNREFGSVFVGEQENVALAVVGNGWAKVRATGTQQSPYYEDLKKAEEAAQLAGAGLWNKDSNVVNKSVRDLIPEEAFDTNEFYQQVGKGKVVDAVVEQVLNGSTLRVYLPSKNAYTMVVLCGVQCPSMGRKVQADAPAEGEAAAPAAPSAAAIAGTSAPEPFAREAKFSTEMRALNRDVKLVIEGVDKFNKVFATVMVPGEGDTQFSMAEHLVKLGYAKCVEWSLNMMSNGAMRMRELERTAKQDRKGMWVSYVPQPTNQTKLSDNFTGKVVEVVSGDCLVVKDAVSGVERRVNLSSLRAPRPPTRSRPADPYANEAKDFLRKKLIGKDVEVKMEYNRKVQPQPGEQGEERTMAFGNVELVPEKGDEKQNVSEMVVARGFATVVRHRTDEERSGVYERLTECEEMAKQAKRGVHSAKEPPANRVNDVSAPGNAARAKQYLPFFQRAGKMQAVVEYVLSGHRLKLYVPKEGASIVFAPSGIKTPSRAMPAGNGKPAQQAEPFADEVLAFTRECMMQRDVEVTIETMDRGGTFLGAISIPPPQPSGKPFNLSLALLKAGYAKLQPQVDISRLPGGQEMLEAQQAAKQARLKIWQNWTPEMDKEEGEEGAEVSTSNGHAASSSSGEEMVPVVVTEVVDATEFYVQFTNEPRVAWITEQLAGMSLDCPIPPELKQGQLCLAQFSLDKQWYRGYVERVNLREPLYEVFFIDYGNKEKVDSNNVRSMDAALAAVPPQAKLCTLSHVKVPTPGTEYAAEAKALLSQLVGGGQPLVAVVAGREKAGAAKDAKHPKWTGGKHYVTLLEPHSQLNVTVELLQAGLVQLPKLHKVRDPRAKEAIAKLQPVEEEARQAHAGMFQYGDPGDSDDEEQQAAPKNAWGAKRA